jgi:hypothetical protein
MKGLIGGYKMNELNTDTKKIGEPQRSSPKYITNTPKYSHEFKRFSFLTTYFIF